MTKELIQFQSQHGKVPRALKAGQMLPQLSAPAVWVGCFNFSEMSSFLGVPTALGVLF